MIKVVVPENIYKGCIQLEILEGYEQLEEVNWIKPCWILHFSITVSEINSLSKIPRITQWYMLIDPQYPRGSISIFPDKISSITQTYQHMNQNIEGESVPWRLGKICTDWENRHLGHLSDDEEPFDTDNRVSWHVKRLKMWLIAASNNSLSRTGDFYELPHNYFNSDVTIVFAEEQKHLKQWNKVQSKSGKIVLKEFKELNKTIFVTEFLDRKSELIQSYDWGRYISNSEYQLHNGVWVLLPFKPIAQPWEYPRTIRELEEICKKHHFDLWNEVYDLMQTFRENEQNFVLIGFRIPSIVGNDDQIIHWISIEIARLAKKVRKIKGFRKALDFYFNRDRMNELKPYKTLKYIQTENWSKEAILSRGSLNKKIHDDSIFLIGAGALGSAIGELLSRTGMSRITICDDDTLKIGNLSRHILSVNKLTEKKAISLSTRLNHNNLHVRSSAITKSFPDLDEEEIEYLEEHDIIIDTTGSDLVIEQLTSFNWTIPKRFVSLSLGYGAKRMYILLSNKHPFPRQKFNEFIQPWLKLEREENENTILPREGIGCYHPLFPARLDDIWTMAGLAIREMEAWWLNPFGSNVFAVYEQQQVNGVPAGVLVMQREVF